MPHNTQSLTPLLDALKTLRGHRFRAAPLRFATIEQETDEDIDAMRRSLIRQEPHVFTNDYIERQIKEREFWIATAKELVEERKR